MNDFFIKDIQARLESIEGKVLVNPLVEEDNINPIVINANVFTNGTFNSIFGGTTEDGFNYLLLKDLLLQPIYITEWVISVFIPDTRYEVSIRCIADMRPYRYGITTALGDVYHGLPEEGRQWMDEHFADIHQAGFQIIPAQSPHGLIHYQSNF